MRAERSDPARPSRRSRSLGRDVPPKSNTHDNNRTNVALLLGVLVLAVVPSRIHLASPALPVVLLTLFDLQSVGFAPLASIPIRRVFSGQSLLPIDRLFPPHFSQGALDAGASWFQAFALKLRFTQQRWTIP